MRKVDCKGHQRWTKSPASQQQRPHSVDRRPIRTHQKHAPAPSLPALRCAAYLQTRRRSSTTQGVVNSSTSILVTGSVLIEVLIDT